MNGVPEPSVRGDTPPELLYQWLMVAHRWPLHSSVPKVARGLAAGAVALWLGVGFPSSATAAGNDPILVTTPTGDTMQFTTADGTASSSLTITNPSDTKLELSMVGIGELASCQEDWTLQPSSVSPHRTVSIVVSTGCPIPETGQVELRKTGAGTIATLNVASETTPTVDLTGILWAFGWSLLAAVIAVVVIAAWLRGAFDRDATEKNKKKVMPETPKDEWATKLPWDDAKQDYQGSEIITHRPIGFYDPLPGVDPKWSFTDSWATSVSGLGTLVVALLGTSSALKAILGQEPTVFLANVLVAGVIAAFFTGAAPMLTKAVGNSTTACVGGVLIGGILTMAGVAGQLWVVGRQFSELSLANALWGWAGYCLPFVLAGLMILYGFVTLLSLLNLNSPSGSLTVRAE